MKRLTKNLPLLLIIGLSILVIWPLVVPGYFSHHDDLHVIRIFEMRKCIADFQIPCRWVPDMGWGYGYPLFNYYNPFIYYLGAIFSYLAGYVYGAKILFLIALTSGPVGMYFLGKELWGKLAGIVSAALFIFVPYRALDAYVRGALAELFAISLMPFIFLFTLRLIKQGKIVNFLVLTTLLGVFLVTHNVSVIIWSPFFLLWIIYSIYKFGLANIKLLVLSLVVGFGLSAFFTLPAYIERNLVTSETLTQGDLDYHVHFATIKQLFLSRFWGYGASKLGPNDDLSMQIGWPYWWLAAASATIVTALAVLKKNTVKKMLLPLLLILFFLVSVFMTHNKSTPVWENIGILKYIQFPWRFLAITAFSTSLLGGYLISILPKYKYFVAVAVIFLAVGLNWSYFKPLKFYSNVNDKEKLSGALWEEQQRGAILDYLPKTALPPKEKALTTPFLLTGKAEDLKFEKNSNSWSVSGYFNGSSKIELPIFNFPNWSVPRDNTEIETSKNGRVVISVGAEGEGNYYKKAFFKDTPIRSAANIITLLSFLVLIGITKYGKKIFK